MVGFVPVLGEIVPIGVEGLHEAFFVGAGACLDLFFTRDRSVYLREGFEVDETVQLVSCSESSADAGAVFAQPASEVVGDACVDDTARGSGEHVHPVVMLAHVCNRE